ncbi:hypothetical protein F4815DRAFT_476732 [Daldinia loculata]|nr:hypothetical protein F4815DRAFT_476732 [Daldinia loculata]
MAEPQQGVPRTYNDPNKPRYRNYRPGATANRRDRASVLIYLQDIPVNSSFPRAGVLSYIPEQLRQYVNYDPVGLEYHDGGVTTNIYGNSAALDLFGEFDSVIEFGNNSSQWIHDTLTEAFGHDAFRGLTLPEMMSLVIVWCRAWFGARNRFLEFATNHTPNVWQRTAVYQDHQRRTAVANENLHAPNIEIDAVWVCVPHLYTGKEGGTNTRGMTNACFRTIYRLNRIEAIAILRLAKEKNPYGTSTRHGLLFRWIVYFINQYVRWRVTVFEEYSKMLPRDHSFMNLYMRKYHQAGLWDDDGGRDIEVNFETLLYWVLEMVRYIQAGLDIPREVMDEFNRVRQNIYDLIDDTRLPPDGFGPSHGPAGRMEDRDFVGNTIMSMDSPDFTFEVTTVLPTVNPIGRRGTLAADRTWCEETMTLFPTPRVLPLPPAPAAYFSDDPDPSDAYTPAMMAQVVAESDDEISAEDYDEEEEPPYTIEIQDGVARRRSLTAPKGPTARLTTSALLRDALWGAGSLKRPARTPLRSVFSGRVAKRRKTSEVIAPDAEEE